MATVPIGVAQVGAAQCDTSNNNTIQKLTKCVTLAGVREHQQAFQAIAERQRRQPLFRIAWA